MQHLVPLWRSEKCDIHYLLSRIYFTMMLCPCSCLPLIPRKLRLGNTLQLKERVYSILHWYTKLKRIYGRWEGLWNLYAFYTDWIIIYSDRIMPKTNLLETSSRPDLSYCEYIIFSEAFLSDDSWNRFIGWSRCKNAYYPSSFSMLLYMELINNSSNGEKSAKKE